jgi:hypothetical protein
LLPGGTIFIGWTRFSQYRIYGILHQYFDPFLGFLICVPTTNISF